MAPPGDEEGVRLADNALLLVAQHSAASRRALPSSCTVLTAAAAIIPLQRLPVNVQVPP